MGAPGPLDPCLEVVDRPSLAGGRRIRVVQVLATGTNGGAQEHLYGLVTRMDRTRYDVSVVSLSPGSAVNKLRNLCSRRFLRPRMKVSMRKVNMNG